MPKYLQYYFDGCQTVLSEFVFLKPKQEGGRGSAVEGGGGEGSTVNNHNY